MCAIDLDTSHRNLKTYILLNNESFNYMYEYLHTNDSEINLENLLIGERFILILERIHANPAYQTKHYRAIINYEDIMRIPRIS